MGHQATVDMQYRTTTGFVISIIIIIVIIIIIIIISSSSSSNTIFIVITLKSIYLEVNFFLECFMGVVGGGRDLLL